jgi:hypothetical protein
VAVAPAAGGGGGANPPPDDTGETVVVSGVVTDMPIPNATVVITVDGESFEAPLPTDANGAYTVEIESSNPDAMVLCEAYDPAGVARFSAMLNNFAGFQALADETGAVEGADITNVTTAQFVLASRLTDDGEIDDLDELQTVSEMVDTEELLELSAAIKVIVDGIDSVVLPEGVADTQALAEAIASGESDFIEQLALTNPGTLEEAIDRVINDGNATTEWTAAEVPGVYVPSDGFSLLVFLEGGVGLEQDFGDESAGAGEFQWSINEQGQLRLDFEGPGGVVETELVTLLTVAGNVISVAVDTVGVEDDGRGTDTAVRFRFDADGFDPATVQGTYVSTSSDEGEASVLLADGTGYDFDLANGIQQGTFTWTIDNAGVISVDDGGGESSSTVYLLEDSTGTTRNLLIVDRDEGLVELVLETFLYEEEIATGPSPDAANTAALAGKTYAQTDPDDLGLFTFGEEGVFTEIFQRVEDTGQYEIGEGEGTWSIDGEGTISVLFPDEAEAGGATVLEGLGEDFMAIRTQADEFDEGQVIDLVRVVPFEAAEPVGTWSAQSDSGEALGTATFNDNGSGTYQEGNEFLEFDWMVDGDGVLKLFLASDGPSVETDSLYKLADSQGDLVHAMLVYRVDGELDADLDSPDSGERPGAMGEVTLIFAGAN